MKSGIGLSKQTNSKQKKFLFSPSLWL